MYGQSERQLTNQPPIREVEEWMLVCQHHSNLQPISDPQENVDWTSASQLYSNLAEFPSFISHHRQSFTRPSFTSNAAPRMLQQNQLEVYNCILQHYEANDPTPIYMVVCGTAGTGKSYLISCLKLLLQDKLRVCAPTGVASYNIDGSTLHSLFNLPTKSDFRQLDGQKLQEMQQSLENMNYLIIDEMSMVGRKTFGQIDPRLRQIFPHHSHQVLGGHSCLLFGDFGQLPPVMDLPLYTTVSRNELSDLGSSTYHFFDSVVVLNQVMRQSGESPEQILFRDILLRLRDGKTTVADWEHLMKQTPSQVEDMSAFDSAVHLFPTVDSVVEYNITQLHAINRPIATIKAVHSGHNASKGTSEDAGGLDPVVYLAYTARIMLIANLWVEVGLVNGALGTVVSICYQDGGPPNLPVAVMVRFDHYIGPTLPDLTVPITPVRRSWSNGGSHCTRFQIPLKLSWAMTIHKAQGLTLSNVVVDVGKKSLPQG